MGGALLTDLYELNMAASYLRRGMNRPATFSLFVRRLPPGRGFLVAAGLEPCLEFLERFGFESDDLVYLRDELGFDAEALGAFRELRFDGEVWAVPEGRIVFADEPLLEITAPIAVAQLVETYLLNQISFQTTIASKAARCRLAARDRDVVDFAFRRTQGVDAAMAVARTTAIAGFASTSNVEAARRYGLRVAGTMAHSYVESFHTEADAFRAFAQDFPGRAVFLVDTYDTVNGVRTVVEVIRELGLTDRLGIRLDSGDLGQLSLEARRILDDAGLAGVRIFASGGLDELDVDRLVQAGAPIDAFGVGTRVGVSADAPY
ncbi:MAG TPA: nicotinate phosphoribosyltransferase, partial [Actinomycetota bacterium]